MTVTIHQGDCVEVMRAMPENSVDAIVTDPPYGIGFMGREWDTFAPARLAELDRRRQRKGTKSHSEMWPDKAGSVQGGGPSVEYDFSRSGAQRFQAWTEAWAREALRALRPGGYLMSFCGTRMQHRMTSGIEDAGFTVRDCLMWLYGSGFPKSLNKLGEAWDGWGTALKPAWEPIVLAQKPLDGTYARNLERWGVGALNIDGSRIGTEERTNAPAGNAPGGNAPGGNALMLSKVGMPRDAAPTMAIGRWPANLVLDEEAAAALDEQSGEMRDGTAVEPAAGTPKRHQIYSPTNNLGRRVTFGGSGGASRFFYTAKADAEDRGPENTHPTVKPVSLMTWLVKLVTPKGGTVLDPFAGSGSTLIAARQHGFNAIGIEREAEYVAIIQRRFWPETIEVAA